jgi:hypothetical protein
MKSPNKAIAFRVTAGPARPTGRYVFESSGNLTTVTFSLDFSPSGLQRLMDGMMQKQRSAFAGHF